MSTRTKQLLACPGKVFGALKCVVDGTLEPVVAIGFGDDLDHSEFFAVSVADARRLRRLLGEAVLAPAPQVHEGGRGSDAPI
jgi:hypothetical protein